VRELRDAGGLADSVHANDQDDGLLVFGRSLFSRGCRLQRAGDLTSEQLADLVRGLDVRLPCLLLDASNELSGRGNSHVGEYQGLLEAFPELAI